MDEIELYFGVDATGNKHVHAGGRCFTNDELDEYLIKVDGLVKALKSIAHCYVDGGAGEWRFNNIALKALEVWKADDS